MAQNKASFLLYSDTIHTVRKLSDEQAGRLFKTILEYVNDENPQVSDPIIDLTFEPIRQSLKRDLKKWEDTKDGKSQSGILGNLKRWHADLYKQVVAKKISIEEATGIANGRKHRTSDKVVANVAVSVSDSVSVIDTDKTIVRVHVDQLKEKLKAEHQYLDDCILKNKDAGLSKENIDLYLDRFIAFLRSPDASSPLPADGLISFLDKKKHFRSWLRKHLSYPQNRNTDPTPVLENLPPYLTRKL